MGVPPDVVVAMLSSLYKRVGVVVVVEGLEMLLVENKHARAV